MFQCSYNFVFFCSDFNDSLNNEIHPVRNFTLQDDVLKLRVSYHFKFFNQGVKCSLIVLWKQLPIFYQSFQSVPSNIISQAIRQFFKDSLLVNTFEVLPNDILIFFHPLS